MAIPLPAEARQKLLEFMLRQPAQTIIWQGVDEPMVFDFSMPPVPVVVLPHFAGPDPKHPLVPAIAGDVGCDVYAPHDVVIPPGGRLVIPTGLMLAVPDGWEAQVRPKSGNAIKWGVTVLNSPGTVDPPYRGEVGVIAHNTNQAVGPGVFDKLLDVLDGAAEVADLHETYDLAVAEATVVFKRGQKVAQIVYAQFGRPEHVVVDTLPETARGAGGYGSTGA